ncbi:hypothetical protein ILYODFUR_006499 [Ilyodon furcidens]|uniref:Uncharacterized protein n=1 Tax=Ilyodon furcidens TaxID=33524 RepID=A0ABV0UF74_9TELE
MPPTRLHCRVWCLSSWSTLKRDLLHNALKAAAISVACTCFPTTTLSSTKLSINMLGYSKQSASLGRNVVLVNCQVITLPHDDACHNTTFLHQKLVVCNV